MTVQTIPLLPEPVCVTPDTSLRDALQLMLGQAVNHVPVCDGAIWAGLLDLNDILGELLPASARVEHGLSNLRFVGDGTALIAAHLQTLATKKVRDLPLHTLPTLDEATPLLEAALLLHRHTAPLPVLRTDGSFKGMLSRRILLAHLITLTEN